MAYRYVATGEVNYVVAAQGRATIRRCDIAHAAVLDIRSIQSLLFFAL